MTTANTGPRLGVNNIPLNRLLLVLAAVPLVSFPLMGSGNALTVSEIMYHPVISPADPPDPEGGEALEYIELYNEGPETEDLSGYAFVEGVRYTFAQGTLLAPRSFLLVASNPDALRDFYASHGVDLTGVQIYGPWDGALDNGGETIELRVEGGGRLIRFDYGDGGQWPAAADGAGHSLELLSPFYDLDEPESWEISETIGGTPGKVGRFKIPTFNPVSNLPSTEWTEAGFDDSGWSQGVTPIGYDPGGPYPIATELSDMHYTYNTVYMRISFDVDAPGEVMALSLETFYDDGFVAYLNGEEVARSSTIGIAPGIPLAYDATCSNKSPEPSSYEAYDITSFRNLLTSGPNWLAIHAINTSRTSSDFVISARLIATLNTGAQILVDEGEEWLYFKGVSDPVPDDGNGEEDTRHHTPGSRNHEPIVLNEFLAATETPDAGDWIELYNRGSEPVEIAGMYISDDAEDLLRFRIPDGLVLDPGDYRVFDRSELGFGLSHLGEKIFLTAADQSRVIDAVNYGEHATPQVSYGRYPDGADEWYVMPAPSKDGPNFVALESSVVINEIMYHPVTENDRDEYIELYNRGTSTVSLTGWQLTKAVRFDFPYGTEIGPGEYLVVAKDPDRIQARYDISNVVGPYDGVLANDGECIRLRDQYDNVVDTVRYYDGGDWPDAADGEGSSLELIDPRDDNDVPAAWAASDESKKSSWTSFSHTSVLTNWWRQPDDELHVFLQHRGEALVDALSITQGGSQFLTNGSFESGAGGWKIEGTHRDSFVTTEDSYDGSCSLHIVATGRGDTYSNRIETDISHLTLNQTYTISGKARWLRGSRWLLVRIHAQGIADAVKLSVPENLGSPGQQNGAYAPNRGPSITQVRQSPVLPNPSQTVTVTARIADADGISAVELFYGVENSGSFASTPMSEIGGPGSGVYTGQIPAQPDGTLMAFYLRATDGTVLTSSYPPDPDYRQCLYQVVASPVLSNFPVYRILIPAKTQQELGTNPRAMSNYLLPCSFIYDDTEIYYNCWIRLRGSPFIRGGYGNPVTTKSGLRIRVAPDNLLHGRCEMNLDMQDPRGGMSSLQNERVAYWICRKIGVPWGQIRYVRVLCNQTDHGLYGDVQKVDMDYLGYWFPGDDDGYLYKIDDWFEFDDGWNFSYHTADLRYWGGGNLSWWGREKELYRWNYHIRSRDEDDNLDPIVNLMSKMDPAMNPSPAKYRTEVASVLDVQEALKEIAVRHTVGDWDSWGYRRGKNNLLYQRPSDGRFVLIPWDIDFVLGSGDGPSTSLTTTNDQYGFDYFFSAFGEQYEQVLWEIAEGPLAPGAADGYLDRTHQILSQEGLGIASPAAIKSYLASRRNYIMQYHDKPVAITTNDGQPFVTSNADLVITGTAPYNAETMTLNGQPIEPEWTSATTWALQGILSPGINEITIELFDGNGQSLGIAQMTITLNPFIIHTLAYTSEGAILMWNSTPGESYRVLAGEIPDALIAISPNLQASTGSLYYIDPDAPLCQRRFYRIKLGEPPLLPGLEAEYFSGTNFANLVVARIDEVIDFNWGEGIPAPKVPADGFSVRWTGSIVAGSSGLYTFYTESDDGVRLTVAGETVIENWTDHLATWNSGDIYLSKGLQPLVLEFYDNTGDAVIRLEYQVPGIPRRLIPADFLGHAP
jgi:hypothetical protein